MTMDYDVLGLTELQNKKIRNCTRWIVSQDAEVGEEGVSMDPAADVDIMLSQRFTKRILTQGSVGLLGRSVPFLLSAYKLI